MHVGLTGGVMAPYRTNLPSVENNIFWGKKKEGFSIVEKFIRSRIVGRTNGYDWEIGINIPF